MKKQIFKKNFHPIYSRNNKGITLIELLISLAIVGIVISLAFSMNIFAQKVYIKGGNKSDIQFNLRLASDYITKEARFATGVEILPAGAHIPATVTNNDTYIFVNDTGNTLVIRDKNGDRTPVKVDGLSILFETSLPSKTLKFKVTGNSGSETFELDSQVLILNIPEDQTIVDSTGSNDGVAVRLSNDLPSGPASHLYFTLPMPYDGIVGVYYNKSFIVVNGSGAYSFELVSPTGTLPDGISLSTSGVLSGTPTTVGSYSFTVKVTDTVSSETATRSFNINIVDPAASDMPKALNLVIVGTVKVGETITGEYDYLDPYGEIESGTIVKWYRMDNESGSNKVMVKQETATADTPSTYTLTDADKGKYIIFEVIPSSEDGRVGSPVSSMPSAVVVGNSPPIASNVYISGTAKVGETLTANYTYSDADGDSEGSTKIVWYNSNKSDGSKASEVGRGKTFEIPNGYQNSYIYIEVTPVAATGEKEGVTVLSAIVGPISKK